MVVNGILSAPDVGVAEDDANVGKGLVAGVLAHPEANPIPTLLITAMSAHRADLMFKVIKECGKR